MAKEKNGRKRPYHRRSTGAKPPALFPLVAAERKVSPPISTITLAEAVVGAFEDSPSALLAIIATALRALRGRSLPGRRV